MSKRSSIKNKRRSKALPALGFAGVSFSLASGACASTNEATANTLSTAQSHELLLGEEEIFDVSLATFYIYDKENGGPSAIPQNLQLARGGCGGGGGCRCGGGGGGCRCGGGGGCGGGIHIGCGGCHVACRGCGGGRFFFGGCFGCAGCVGSCWIWAPPWGWVWSCSAELAPADKASHVVASEQSAPITEAAAKVTK